MKLADFGSARVTSATTTQTMAAAVTPRYVAPKQWRDGEVDA